MPSKHFVNGVVLDGDNVPVSVTKGVKRANWTEIRSPCSGQQKDESAGVEESAKYPSAHWFDSLDSSGTIQRIKQRSNRSHRSNSKPMLPGIGVLRKDDKLGPSAVSPLSHRAPWREVDIVVAALMPARTRRGTTSGIIPLGHRATQRDGKVFP